MPRAPRGSGSTRRPESGTPVGIGRSRRTAQAARSEAVPHDTVGSHPTEPAAGPASPRFRIFIVDPGWDSPAHQVLQANFGLIRDLQKDDPIYVLGRDKSISFLRDHPERFGREPIIAVHDMAELHTDGSPHPDFHGFRLHLGLMRTHKQALMALQYFVRFLATHRESVDLEAEIRKDLRREGLSGAIEIILQHEAREIGE